MQTATSITADELREVWPLLTPAERQESFGFLPRGEAEELFLELRAADQLRIVVEAPVAFRRTWMRLLAPIIRALALSEVRLRDWFRVIRRELAAGLSLGAILGVDVTGLIIYFSVASLLLSGSLL